MAFKIYFYGAEQSSHKNLLEAEGETHAGISFWGLKRRLPKTKPFSLADRMPESFEIMLDSGGYSANKSPIGVADLEDYAGIYQDFVTENIERVSLVTEFDCLALGPQWIEHQRKTFWEEVDPKKFVPVWHGDQPLSELERLSATYENVGIPESALVEHPNLAMRINTLQGKYGTDFHALACAKPDNLHSVRFDSAATTSWLSPMKYGETIVWDGSRMHRYTANYKQQARTRHKMLFTRAGFDADAIIADDHNEVTRFTLWSFRQMEEHVDKRRPPLVGNPFTLIQGGKDNDDEALVGEIVTNNDTPGLVPFAETPPAAVDKFVEAGGTGERPAPKPREAHERQFLPVFGFVNKEGERLSETSTDEEAKDRQLVPSGAVLRRCDFCYLAANCPAFRPQTECAYSLPVEIKTREQRAAAMRAVLSLQVDRVAFLAMGEKTNGDAADPNLSQEIDRFFKLLEKEAAINDDSSYLKISMQSRGESSLIRQIFGGEAVTSRSQPDEVPARMERMLDTGIVDAEIIE